jgi:Ca2+:H+ antiporter
VAGYTPIVDSVTNTMRDPSLPPIQLPPPLTADDFTRAVAVATVSALRHQQDREALRPRGGDVHEGAHGGHDAPSWSRLVSASVLLGCTVLYAVIAGRLCVLLIVLPST